jgi:hypothetical protein
MTKREIWKWADLILIRLDRYKFYLEEMCQNNLLSGNHILQICVNHIIEHKFPSTFLTVSVER